VLKVGLKGEEYYTLAWIVWLECGSVIQALHPFKSRVWGLWTGWIIWHTHSST